MSDPDGSVAKKYGADRGGRPFARRFSYVIDRAGVLRHVFQRIKIGQHGAQVIEKITELAKNSEERKDAGKDKD